MPTATEANEWADKIQERYKSYLQTLFYFKDQGLRDSFEIELGKDGLMKGPIPEPAKNFALGKMAKDLAMEFFPDQYQDILPALALIDKNLYDHQEKTIRAVYKEKRSAVVATGTASGKTESFLYPILFELYRQHIEGKLKEPGVRALILYPMNALANDQRERLGEICKKLQENDSTFAPTFGQYIGSTPNNRNDNKFRQGEQREAERLPGELVHREEMRKTPPNILLTNYSMLEYLLIRPEDSELFDGEAGKFWQFLVLDEAHQYRGVRGMEMSMLMRRLKQRLKAGGQNDRFRCIATSATISSDSSDKEKVKEEVADFANNLFGEESYRPRDVILGTETQDGKKDRRFHVFMRALEGAFLVHQNGVDSVILNRRTTGESKPLEIALCRDCGQHYYVGRKSRGFLVEAIRDPGGEVEVDFYLPLGDDADEGEWLCRVCGKISNIECVHGASIKVRKCDSDEIEKDQLKKCDVCDSHRGSMGDPVQEIVHGAVGPNAVIVTAWHNLLTTNHSNNNRKILSFADSRQDAAFFAWYMEDTYEHIRDRNLIWRAFRKNKDKMPGDGLSIDSLSECILQLPETEEILTSNEKNESHAATRRILTIIFRELITAKRRMALSGVGLVKWGVKIPKTMQFPQEMFQPPWGFNPIEAQELLAFLLDNVRSRRALSLPAGPSSPSSQRVFIGYEKQQSIFNISRSGNLSWTSNLTAVGKFMKMLLDGKGLSDTCMKDKVRELLNAIWDCIQSHDTQNPESRILTLVPNSPDAFRLNHELLRGQLPKTVYECKVCANISVYNIRDICRYCGGELGLACMTELEKNHYRILYQDNAMAMNLRSAEHTAQIKNDVAQDIQRDFKAGNIDLLSTSTTFEVGVDLGELESVFLRNVPPEPYNYTQRVGRVGRREKPGMAITYCRRNPHDLYHYQDPKGRILHGATRTPRLHLKNSKIILRHMTAVALSRFFKDNSSRFPTVECFIGGDWDNPAATKDFIDFCCSEKQSLQSALKAIVPCDKHSEMGLMNSDWIEFMTKPCDDINGGRCLQIAEMEARADYNRASKVANKFRKKKKDKDAWYAQTRADTIAENDTLSFLSRKAIIPTYGFPVDVVELDVSMSGNGLADKVSLRRDLSQAIAEYAPGSKIIAYKKEWESCGFKVVRDKAPRIVNYSYDGTRMFETWEDDESPSKKRTGFKYLCPEFGFVTSAEKRPKQPTGQPRRLYTTRPFFRSFKNQESSESIKESEVVPGVKITQALPGKMVVLCEGKNRSRFFLCKKCGSGFSKQETSHKDPFNKSCDGRLQRLSLGHEFLTDIVRIKIPGEFIDEWTIYSVAYAILLGSARALDVPDEDLNVTITGAGSGSESAIILYDNVPGGAGLVADLINRSSMISALKHARERVGGACGCDESCYGCLRSYRNQFAHPHLRRQEAFRILVKILSSTGSNIKEIS